MVSPGRRIERASWIWRAANGVTRAEYLARFAEAREQREAEGISIRTQERRRKAGLELSRVPVLTVREIFLGVVGSCPPILIENHPSMATGEATREEETSLRGQPSQVEAPKGNRYEAEPSGLRETATVEAVKTKGEHEAVDVARYGRLEGYATFAGSKTTGPVTPEEDAWLREEFGLGELTAAEIGFVQMVASRQPHAVH